MISGDSLYGKDPAAARYAAGGVDEAEALFGAPLPPLPPCEVDAHEPVWFVRLHPQLRASYRRLLEALVKDLETPARTSTAAPRAGGSGALRLAVAEQAEYEAALGRMLRAARRSDRRQGLVTLFWLAHSKDAAACLAEYEARKPIARRLRPRLPALLQPIHRAVEDSARATGLPPEARDRVLQGIHPGNAITDAIVGDGFAFVHGGIEPLDLNAFQAPGGYRLPDEAFREMHQVLSVEVERRFKERERGLMARLERHFGAGHEALVAAPGGAARVALHQGLVEYLFADASTLAARLSAAPRVRAEFDRRRSWEVAEAFLDMATAVRRFEVICHLRDRVRVAQGLAAEQEFERRLRAGDRVFEFAEAAKVANNAVNATVLFLDLRGFTQTSEGQISEAELTRELYTVFDAFVPIVRRFDGIVDKFLGDGMMVTFGAERGDHKGPLHAVRTAVLCQEALARLRHQGRTAFRMGVSIHYGRVYVARFIADEENVQTTVIGRNVNLAGRLSSAAKKPLDQDEFTDPGAAAAPSNPEMSVTVGPDGALFNEGIALSRAGFVQLETLVELKEVYQGPVRLMGYSDEELGRRVLLRYAGDAKFKGVRATFPVFEVDPEAPRI